MTIKGESITVWVLTTMHSFFLYSYYVSLRPSWWQNLCWSEGTEQHYLPCNYNFWVLWVVHKLQASCSSQWPVVRGNRKGHCQLISGTGSWRMNSTSHIHRTLQVANRVSLVWVSLCPNHLVFDHLTVCNAKKKKNRGRRPGNIISWEWYHCLPEGEGGRDPWMKKLVLAHVLHPLWRTTTVPLRKHLGLQENCQFILELPPFPSPPLST